jgi:hypothetical protein
MTEPEIDVTEWEAFLDEALRIPESAADKDRRLRQLQRDMLTANLPPGGDALIARTETAIMALEQTQ